jgi:hypothetical protein
MEPIRVQGRTIGTDDLAWLREIIAHQPQWHRTALSRHLCEVWNWRNDAGRFKDMAARTLLLKLEARGLIQLPTPQRRNDNRQRRAQPPENIPGEFPFVAPPPIDRALGGLQPVRLELIDTLRLRRQVSRLMTWHHYRGFGGAVGENVQYLAREAGGREVAVMVFGAAAWQVAARDQFIGWSPQQRAQRLSYLTNQQRFLILPWVQVPHLASHLLALLRASGVAGGNVCGIAALCRHRLPSRGLDPLGNDDRTDPTRSRLHPPNPHQSGVGSPLAPPFSPLPHCPMKLLDLLLKYTRRWAEVFPQERSLQRAIALAFGILCGVGKRTITRAISFQGNTQKDWSADYKVFSRSPWEPRSLFNPILEVAIQTEQLQRIVTSFDDTRVWRNGQHVPQTQWHRDPLGPPFQTNLRWGHRFLQASLVLPLYQRDGQSSSRSIPIRFEMAPVVKKPGKKATEADLKTYRRLKNCASIWIRAARPTNP